MAKSSHKQELGVDSTVRHVSNSRENDEYSLEDSIAYQLRLTYKYFNDKLQPLLQAHGVPVGMWYFLRVLWEKDGLTQREISERVGLVAPTTVEQLRNMEKRGLIERHRSAEDHRKVHVYLSAKGKALKAKVLPIAPYVNKLAVEGLSAGEVGFLRLVLTRMRQNLTRPDNANSEAPWPSEQPKKRSKAARSRRSA